MGGGFLSKKNNMPRNYVNSLGYSLFLNSLIKKAVIEDNAYVWKGSDALFNDVDFFLKRKNSGVYIIVKDEDEQNECMDYLQQLYGESQLFPESKWKGYANHLLDILVCILPEKDKNGDIISFK